MAWAKDQLYKQLRAIGVDARIAPADQPEAKYNFDIWVCRSLIDIEGSPISWASIWEDNFDGRVGDFVEYGVRDSRHLPLVSVRPVEIRSFRNLRSFGRVIDVKWKEDSANKSFDKITGLEVSRSLNEDETVRKAIISISNITKDEIRVGSSPAYGYWGICVDLESRLTPRKWALYENIATRLLATPLPKGNG